jgi:cholesterol oxidase
MDAKAGAWARDDASEVAELDYVVVGSGFGGSVSALRLAEKGYSVVVVEQGKRYHAKDFARTNLDLRRSLWRPEVGCYGILQLTLLNDVFVLHGAGVGGGSLVYANTLLVPPDAAFENAGWVGRDWKATLRPHYQTAQRMLGVVDAPEFHVSDQALLQASRELGRADELWRARVGVYFGEPGKTVPDPYFGGAGPERTGCVKCGACMTGCRFGAKNTLDRNYLYLAEQRGVQVLPEHKVVRIEPQPGGGYELTLERVTGWLHPRRRLRAKNVVLSAGVLGTVPLLMRCKAEGWLPRLSDQLGDRVRTNSEAFVAVRANSEANALGGSGIAISAGINVDEKTHIEAVRYSAGSELIGFLATPLTDGDGGPWRRRWRWLGQLLRRPWQIFGRMFPRGWAQRSVLLMVMQPIENYLRLRLGRRPWWPFSLTVRSERATDQPIPTYFPVVHDIARQMSKNLGAEPQSSILDIALNVSTTAHILGGCPMGTSAVDGVIDDRCRVFGYEGLYVIDGSAVPANLGVNPSLTITALAEHAMAQIPAREERGDSRALPAGEPEVPPGATLH